MPQLWRVTDTNREFTEHKKGFKKMSEKIIIEIIRGVEGDCLAIDNRRVAGPKPWGGGEVTKSFKVELSEIIKAIPVLGIKIEPSVA
jgi:hypothetical protein